VEFRIARAELLRGLRLAQGIADRKTTMPMLANVLLRTQGKNPLRVAAAAREPDGHHEGPLP
jgi:DNA polymerase-3 subunit beta